MKKRNLFLILILLLSLLFTAACAEDTAPYFKLTDGKLTGSATSVKYVTRSQWTDGRNVTIHSYTQQPLDNGSVRFTLTYTAPAGFEIAVFDVLEKADSSQLATGKTIAEKSVLTFDLEEKKLASMENLYVSFARREENEGRWQFLIVRELDLPPALPKTDGTPYGNASEAKYYTSALWQGDKTVTVDSLTMQELDNGKIRLHCVYTAPQGCRISAFDPPDGDAIKGGGEGTTNGKKSSFDFDMERKDLATVKELTVKFWDENDESQSFLIVIDTAASVPAHTHNIVTDAAVPAACTESGLTEGSHCSACGEVLTKQEVIPAKGHTEMKDAAKDATCTETGLTEGKHCSVCGEVLTAQEVIPKKGHTEVKDAGKDATCTETGLTEGKHCSVCSEVLTNQEVIPAKGHTMVNGVCSVCGYHDPEKSRSVGKPGWMMDANGRWVYGDPDGYALTGIQTIGGTKYCFDEKGNMAVGWAELDGKWYFAEESGALVTGWKSIGGTWYYFRNSGEMATGWISDGGAWYYMKDSGAMATGWVEDGKDWYFMKDNGTMATGWVKSGNDWYYMRPTGVMATGWVQDGAWYYFSGSGKMVTGWQRIGGSWYCFKSSGAMQTGWFEDKEAEKQLPANQKKELWYWFDNSGAMATGWKEINGSWEMFDDSGLWLYTWQGN